MLIPLKCLQPHRWVKGNDQNKAFQGGFCLSWTYRIVCSLTWTLKVCVTFIIGLKSQKRVWSNWCFDDNDRGEVSGVTKNVPLDQDLISMKAKKNYSYTSLEPLSYMNVSTFVILPQLCHSPLLWVPWSNRIKWNIHNNHNEQTGNNASSLIRTWVVFTSCSLTVTIQSCYP